MTKQVTPEEDKRQIAQEKYERLKETIAKINGYNSTPRIDIVLVTREQARGRQYLDSMFDTIRMNSDGSAILPEDTLLHGRLFYKLQEKLHKIRASGQRPEVFSLDFLNTYTWSNCTEDYTYLAIFYGGKSK